MGQIAFLHRSSHSCSLAVDNKPGDQGFRPGSTTPGQPMTLNNLFCSLSLWAPHLSQEGLQKPRLLTSLRCPGTIPVILAIYTPSAFGSLNCI